MCDVSEDIGFLGGKLRLLAPIPYVAPFIELGLGVSFGTIHATDVVTRHAMAAAGTVQRRDAPSHQNRHE